MKQEKVLIISSLCLLLFLTVAAQADVTWNYTFTDTGPGAAEWGPYDQSGWVTVYADNQSSVAWGDFHFEIFQIPDSGVDISNVKFEIITNSPSSSQTLDSGTPYVLSSGDKKIDIFYYGDPYASGATGGWWKIHIDNPDGALHGVSYYPTVVPEPISSALFIIGGATLGVRRFLRKK